MKKLLAILLATAVSTVVFAHEASAPEAATVAPAHATAHHKVVKKHHHKAKKHHAMKKEASSAAM